MYKYMDQYTQKPRTGLENIYLNSRHSFSMLLINQVIQKASKNTVLGTNDLIELEKVFSWFRLLVPFRKCAQSCACI